MNHGKEYFRQIREQAERILQGAVEREEDWSQYDVEKIFHELQVHQIELEMQNEELQNTQEELVASRDKYLRLYDLAPVGYCTLDREGIIQQMNETGARLLKIARSMLLGKPFILYAAPGDDAVLLTHLRRVFSTRKPQRCELRLRLRDKSEVDVQMESVVQPGEEAPSKTCWTVLTDISIRKEAERLLKSTLQEKDALLAEIHHRVKNNLQVVCSLLDFQQEYVENDHTIAILRESQARIKTMAMIHEQLYGTPDLAHIDFAAYVERLASGLVTAYNQNVDYVDVLLNIHDIPFDIKRAIPCGLLINELVSNSLKYAFPPDAAFPHDHAPRLEISLLPAGNQRVRLTVRDNGVGLPSDFTFPNENTLGMFLIQTFAEQLYGTVEWSSEDGTRCSIVFDWT